MVNSSDKNRRASWRAIVVGKLGMTVSAISDTALHDGGRHRYWIDCDKLLAAGVRRAGSAKRAAPLAGQRSYPPKKALLYKCTSVFLVRKVRAVTIDYRKDS